MIKTIKKNTINCSSNYGIYLLSCFNEESKENRGSRQIWELVLLHGQADLTVDAPGGTVTHRLRAGDWLELPAHRRHRVEATDTPTVWLALFWPA